MVARSRSGPEIPSPAGENQPNTVAETVSPTPFTNDTDKDGLTDSEEWLYTTNPMEKDSDGDGIGDGQELEFGSSPLEQEKNPQKETGGPDPLKKIKNQYQYVSLLAKTNFSEKFLNQFLVLARINNFTQEEKNSAFFVTLNKYLRPIKEKLPKFTPESVPDSLISINETSNNDTIREYLNAVAGIYKKYLSGLAGFEIQTIYTALKTQNNAELKNLSPYRAAITSALKEIINLSVPRAALLLHKKEIWRMQNTIAQTELLESAKIGDPLYLEMLLDMRKSLRGAATLFHAREVPRWAADQNVLFQPGDNALLFYPNLPQK